MYNKSNDNFMEVIMEEVYLDNSATTKVCDESAEKIFEMLTLKYGNPSSLHSKGIEAENEIKKSREIISDYLNCNNDEIFFTSGGTESNNLAIFGAAKALKRSGNKIVTTAIEHPSVIEPVKELSRLGFETVFINPDKNGFIPEEKLYNNIDDRTILISMMIVNNEVGTIQNLNSLKKIIKVKKSPALLHMDAVQGFGKMSIKPSKIGVDLATFSAHKIHGAKGVGGLYVSKKARILPILFGGMQEKSLRPGTESAALIAGFGAAVRSLPDVNKEYNYILELNLYLRNKLKEIKEVVINSTDDALPYILNFSVCGIKSETMLHYLSSYGVYVSSGSACSKGKKSHVLLSMGLDDNIIDSSIRVSFSRFNNKNDVDILINVLKLGIENIVKGS